LSYITDARRLKPGSIVKVESPLGSSGKPTYAHFFIVLFMPDPLRAGSQIPLVGISSRIDAKSADPAKHVAMKWADRKTGDPETGFSKPCYACMDFTHVITVSNGEAFPLQVAAEFNAKFIRAEKFRTVVATMNAWTGRKRS
jgi:hypothetical protein